MQTTFRGENIKYSQISSTDDMNTSGIFALGNGIRLEPATLNDKTLPGGVYITDTAYRPLLVLDSRGTIRYLDTTIKWSVTMEGKNIVYTLTRDKAELGKIIIHGDMMTTWGGK